MNAYFYTHNLHYLQGHSLQCVLCLLMVLTVTLIAVKNTLLGVITIIQQISSTHLHTYQYGALPGDIL